MQRVRLANRGRLLLRTPGPVPFGTCICSNVETILSWTCHVYGPFEFRTSLGTSNLLFTLCPPICIPNLVIAEKTILLSLGPSTVLYRSFLKHCTLTNDAVGTIWLNDNPRTLWLLSVSLLPVHTFCLSLVFV